jgi:hypothetical protein
MWRKRERGEDLCVRLEIRGWRGVFNGMGLGGNAKFWGSAEREVVLGGSVGGSCSSVGWDWRGEMEWEGGGADR